MSSSGGSAAIREAIEAKRSKIKAPGESLKTLERTAKRKKAWWNETINIACLDEDGEPVEGCAWKVPRRRLTPAWLQSMCLNCPMHVKIEYLKDQTTGDIVWPPNAQLECHPPPWRYAVVAVEEKEVIDRSRDPFYYGDVRVIIFNVPLKTDNDQAEVAPEDLRAWLLCGLAEEDEEVKEAQDIVRTLEQEAKVVEANLSRVGYMKFTEKVGFGKTEKQTLTDEEQAAEREQRFDALTAQRDKMEEDVTEGRAVLERILEHRRSTPVNLELASVQRKCGTCTYYVSFPGFQGSQLEDIVCAKTDWPGIKLATKHEDLPPWAGRGEIPDGSKSYIPRYTEHAVNMRAAQICRLQHGFGQHKVARSKRKKPQQDLTDAIPTASERPATTPVPRPMSPAPFRGTTSSPASPVKAFSKTGAKPTSAPGSPESRDPMKGKADGDDDQKGGKPQGLGEGAGIPFAGKTFSFFHGEFQEGSRSGFGTEFTDAGVHCGEYKDDRRCGKGALHCANGDLIEGNFVSETRFPDTENSHNPYREGVPDGSVEIQFASGATYTGEMKQGRITGKGEFVSCLGERYSGDFVDGSLHGDGSIVDVVGQAWEGQWHEGEMHGEGTHSAPEAGRFEGDWVNGEWHGRGRLVSKGGNTYEGYFLDHGRCGPGTLLRGNVKSVYDPRSGNTALRSNRVYEGSWRASRLRPGSMVTLTKTGDMFCVGTDDAGLFNRAVNRIKRRERQVHRKTTESLDFYGRYETLLRTMVENKKSRVYSKQAKAANQDLIDDHFDKVGVENLKAAFSARAINIEQIMRVSGKVLEANAGSIERAATRLEQRAAAKGTTSNRTALSSLVQSRLEEAQELQHLVNITDVAERAEKMAHAQQGEINYSA